MNKALQQKILFAGLRAGRELTVTVAGTSMNPSMIEGDSVTVRRTEPYMPGDVLVFLYKGELLIHRLLKVENNRYFCKGDNSFRLEDFSEEDIAGKVILHNGKPLSPVPPYAVSLSYQVSRCFRKCSYNIEKTKESGIYRFYYQMIWKTEDKALKYRRNENMEYILSDETSLAVFDPETGDTHFFDETGIDILNALDEPCDIDMLLERLCSIYDAIPDEIREDVLEFLADCIAKQVIEVI